MNYEFSGKDYQKASEHQTEWGLQIIAELNLGGRERILDLGCGDGKLTSHLADLLPDGSVRGIDASESMLEVAKRYAKPNLCFRLQDINDIAYGDEFDVIFSNATLHWVLDHRRLLGNVWKALARGGILRFNFAGDGNCSTFFSVVRELMEDSRFQASFAGMKWPWYMPPVTEYNNLVGEFPFVDVQVWEEKADRFFADSDAMIRWIDQPSLVPFLPYLPDGMSAEFRDAVIERMIERTRQPDGRCFETFRRINVFARRPG